MNEWDRERKREVHFIAGSSINMLLYISAVQDSISIQIPASTLHFNNKTMEADNVNVGHRWQSYAMDKVKQTFESHRGDSNRLLNITGPLVITLFIFYLWRELGDIGSCSSAAVIPAIQKLENHSVMPLQYIFAVSKTVSPPPLYTLTMLLPSFWSFIDVFFSSIHFHVFSTLTQPSDSISQDQTVM